LLSLPLYIYVTSPYYNPLPISNTSTSPTPPYIIVKSKVGLGGVTSKIAGSNITTASVTAVTFAFVTNAYACPLTLSGTTVSIIPSVTDAAILTVSSPFTNVT
jgi:hypothetical protein